MDRTKLCGSHAKRPRACFFTCLCRRGKRVRADAVHSARMAAPDSALRRLAVPSAGACCYPRLLWGSGALVATYQRSLAARCLPRYHVSTSNYLVVVDVMGAPDSTTKESKTPRSSPCLPELSMGGCAVCLSSMHMLLVKRNEYPQRGTVCMASSTCVLCGTWPSARVTVVRKQRARADEE